MREDERKAIASRILPNLESLVTLARHGEGRRQRVTFVAAADRQGVRQIFASPEPEILATAAGCARHLVNTSGPVDKPELVALCRALREFLGLAPHR